MGRDKASLPFGDTTVLERIACQLARYFDDLIVVTGPAAEGSRARPMIKPSVAVTMLHDEIPFQGPVGALARGLAHARRPIVFACSCDLPLLDGAVAQALCAMLDGFDAVMPEVGAGVPPLSLSPRPYSA
jgi:molybdenum cofactor guanylyltransferase